MNKASPGSVSHLLIFSTHITLQNQTSLFLFHQNCPPPLQQKDSPHPEEIPQRIHIQWLMGEKYPPSQGQCRRTVTAPTNHRVSRCSVRCIRDSPFLCQSCLHTPPRALCRLHPIAVFSAHVRNKRPQKRSPRLCESQV